MNHGYYLGKCCDCEQEKMIIDTICPYAQDICNETIEISICDDCLYQRAMDI